MKKRIVLSDSHLALANDIKEICKPLFDSFNINYFLYTKMFRDNSCIWLCSRSEWISHYCEMQYYDIGTFEQNIDQYKSGMFLWRGINNSVLQDARQNFNIDHGITIIDKSENWCEFYHFAATQDNHSIVNFYINYPDVLRHFITYFKEKAQKIILSVNKYKIVLPAKHMINPLVQSDIVDQNVINKFIDDISCKKIYLDSSYNNAILTTREFECIKWLAKGKTAEEIGLILNIARRTVINHLENIKKKTGCYKSNQLIKIATNFGMGDKK